MKKHIVLLRNPGQDFNCLFKEKYEFINKKSKKFIKKTA